MKNRIIKRLTVVAVLCALVLTFAVPAASAASYSNVYGQTQDRVRVRASASTSATIIDNIVKDACVYVLSSKTSGNNTFVQVRYRDSDGNTATGWVCQKDASTTYIKILSAEQAEKAFGVKGGTVPSKRVGTFTAAERSSASAKSSSTSSSSGTDTDTVKSVQTKLKALGYYSGQITGNVGEKTKAAIKEFQSRNGLTVDGVIGPQTLGKIDAAYAAKGGSSGTSSSGGDIKLNSEGSDVRKLQQDLKELGFYNAEITGKVGAKTEAAIKAFQRKYGLSADGVAGAKTLAAIASALRGSTTSTGNTTIIREGSQGSRVSQLQQDLKTLGYYSAQITGNVGSKTVAAIKKFQEKNGLTADGIAGPDTLAAIAKQVGNGGSSSSSSGSGLRLNSSGDAVRALQQNLTTLGYYYGDITGHYGSMTEAAVRKFQKARGMTADGVAGSSTLAAITSALQGSGSTVAGSSSSAGSLREGDSGSAVTELQNMLKSLGYYYGEVTGHYGSLTRQAVRKFQEANKLTIDGIAGPATLNKLRSLTGNSSSSSESTSSGAVTSMANSYGRITKNNVYLRSSYSTTSASKASLKQGTLVRITKTVVSGGVRWYYVTVTVGSYTYKGYIRGDMMEILTEDQYNSAGGDSSLGAGDSETLGIIRVTANNVRLRYEPNTDAAIVGYANNGDTFYYVDHVNGWYQTSSGYWISTDYVTVLSGKDEDDYLGTSNQSSYRYNDTGSMVTYIQQVLAYLGYYKAEITGHFGGKTEDAVKAFQRAEGLNVDGVVGTETLARLRSQYSGNSSAQTPDIGKGTVVYDLEWFGNKSWLNSIGLSRSKNALLTDLTTNRSLNIYIQSTGNHADVEPLTASDTTTLCEIFGVSDPSKISYKRRPMLLTVGNYKFVCSIYGEPHGSQVITNNNYPGQFCLHFTNSRTHETNVVNELHQTAIKQAVKIMKDRGATVLTTHP